MFVNSIIRNSCVASSEPVKSRQIAIVMLTMQVVFAAIPDSWFNSIYISFLTFRAVAIAVFIGKDSAPIKVPSVLQITSSASKLPR